METTLTYEGPMPAVEVVQVETGRLWTVERGASVTLPADVAENLTRQAPSDWKE